MKHVKTYESFRNLKNTELQPINEELFGGVINFFKNLWKKTVEDMKKILSTLIIIIFLSLARSTHAQDIL